MKKIVLVMAVTLVSNIVLAGSRAMYDAKELTAVLSKEALINSFKTDETINSVKFDHETGNIVIYSRNNNMGNVPSNCVRTITVAIDTSDVWNPKYSIANIDTKCRLEYATTQSK